MPVLTRRMTRNIEVIIISDDDDDDVNESVNSNEIVETIIISDDDDDADESVLNDIECPICRDVMMFLVPFCENGHLFCLQCLRNDVLIRGQFIDDLFTELPCILFRTLVVNHYYFYM